jgi:hypothetical protein
MKEMHLDVPSLIDSFKNVLIDGGSVDQRLRQENCDRQNLRKEFIQKVNYLINLSADTVPIRLCVHFLDVNWPADSSPCRFDQLLHSCMGAGHAFK